MISTQEIKELLKSREPVLHRSIGVSMERPLIEYDYIYAVVTTYNPETRRYKLTLQLIDKNGNAIVNADPKDVFRKDGAGE